jgi:hypothetical protein
MKKITTIILLGWAILLPFCTSAYILEITIIPSSPNVTDSVRVAYRYDTTKYPARILSRKVLVNANYIEVYLCCGYGQQDGGIHLRDTVNLGTLPEGNYTGIMYWDVTSLTDTFCSEGIIYDTAHIAFTVGGANGLSQLNELDGFGLLPNPAANVLRCRLANYHNQATYIITAADGRVMVPAVLSETGETEIDISRLPAGIYFCTLQDERIKAVRKFIKQ